MIEVKNISKKFNNNVVLNGIDLNINKGDVVAIIGPSGTGKSTFLRCLNRLEKPESGSITIDDSTGKCNGRPDRRKENGQEESRGDCKRTA